MKQIREIKNLVTARLETDTVLVIKPFFQSFFLLISIAKKPQALQKMSTVNSVAISKYSNLRGQTEIEEKKKDRREVAV